MNPGIRTARRTAPVMLVVLLAAGIGLGSTPHAARLSNEALYGTRIRLARAVFDPLLGAPRIPKAFAVDPSGAELWLVQMHFPATAAGLESLRGIGLRLLGVVPDATFVVRATPAEARTAARNAAVRAVVPLQPWYKVPAALDRIASHRALIRVGTFPDAAAGNLAQRLRSGGVEVVRVDSSRILTAWASRTQLSEIASDAATAAIFPVVRMVPMNAIARWVTQSARRAYTPLTDQGLTGAGESVAIADTGLNYYPDRNGMANWYFSDCADPLHPTRAACKKADRLYQAPDGNSCAGSGDLLSGTYTKSVAHHRKVVAYFNDVAACAAIPGDSGASTHGTHVGGSVGGDRPPYGVLTGEDGQAWQAKLAFQDIGDDGEGLAGLPGDLYQLFDQAYDLGVDATSDKDFNQPEAADKAVPYVRGVSPRVHSNSWGSFIPAISLGNSPRSDDFVTNNEDMAIVVAAGNSGPDQASVGEPGTAKDVITSGAMANGSDDFASLDTMANFSSHGEALNGGVLPFAPRIKPDVADPGLRIVSAKGGTNTEEQVLQGTSMSTPTLSGDAALVRQYFEDGFGPGGSQGNVTGMAGGARGSSREFNPSAALVKAVLINSAQRMRGAYTGTQGSDATQNGMWPSDGQGWGRIQLDRALYLRNVPGSPNLWVQDTEYCPPPAQCGNNGHGVATGDDVTYKIRVAPGQPLKVVLAWSDPGGLTSAIGLGPEYIVNQLELQVDAPDGTSYCGNNINTMTAPSADVATSMAGVCNALTDDKANNVQGVFLPAPAPGAYTVHVIGQLVMQNQSGIGVQIPPGGKQGYALAATGRFPAAPSSAARATREQTPIVTSSGVAAPAADLAVVQWSTNVPTTASATITSPSGARATVADVYSRPASSYTGLAITQIENDGQFLDKPMLSTQHVVKFTGLSPGTRYTLSLSATDATGSISRTSSGPSFTTPASVFAPTVGADTATLYSANTDIGPPVPDATEDNWGNSSQFYAGKLTSTASVACRVAAAEGVGALANSCPPVLALGAFKIRLPEGVKLAGVTGAAIELFTRHDLTSRVQEVPRHRLELIADSAEGNWGSGTTYQDVAGDATDAVVGDPTVWRRVPYDVESFTFTCGELGRLLTNLSNGQAAFRITSAGDTLDESVFGWETGFGRRSSGLEYRPRLVLFGATGDPLAQRASTAPVVSQVRTERVDGSTAIIHWLTDQPSDSVVLLHAGAKVVQVGSPSFVTDHHVVVDNVAKGERWIFAVRSTAPDGTVATADASGRGWLITDKDPAPPGPALAALGPQVSSAGAASFKDAAWQRVANKDSLDFGTGRACKPLVLAAHIRPVRIGRGTNPPLAATGVDGRAQLVGLAILLALAAGWQLERVRVRRRDRP